MQNFIAFGCNNTVIAGYQWFRQFGLVFESDTILNTPRFCVAREIIITNRHAKFDRFWLQHYRDRCLSVVPAIQPVFGFDTKLTEFELIV